MTLCVLKSEWRAKADIRFASARAGIVQSYVVRSVFRGKTRTRYMAKNRNKLGLFTAALFMWGCQSTSDNGTGQSVHERILTIDAHVDFPLAALDKVDLGSETELAFDLPKMERGGVDGAFFVIYTPQGKSDQAGYEQARTVAESRYQIIRNLVTSYPDRISLAKNADDAQRIAGAGRRIAFIGMENAYPLGKSTHDVALWADRGVRYMGLTHWGHNQFGDSSNPNFQYDTGPRHGGLSDLGRALVEALNDNGILVDVSHVGRQTMMEAAAQSRGPVIASHSGAKAMTDSARNLDDEQLLAIAKTGGVVNMMAYAANVKSLTSEQRQFRSALRRDMGIPESADFTMSLELEIEYNQRLLGMYNIEPIASVKDYVDHVDYITKLIGVDHVGLSSDFDYVDDTGRITGWYDATQSEVVTAELIERGYSEEDIAKLWGRNMLRALSRAEFIANQL